MPFAVGLWRAHPTDFTCNQPSLQHLRKPRTGSGGRNANLFHPCGRNVVPADTHAYLSPDLRWMGYNACLSGKPEVYVAAIPPALLDGARTGDSR